MKKVLYLVFCLIYLVSSCIPAFGQDYDYGNSWAKNEIDYMKNRGIVSGYPDGTFKPSNNMSKAEFYKIINCIMGFTQKSEINFNDVVSENWYCDDVMKGVAANYILPAESLNAGENITRGEVARIIGIVFGIEEDKTAASDFTDQDTIPEELKGIIGGLKKNGFINGYPDGTFKVNGEITRAEVVKILNDISGEIVNEEGTVNKNTDKNLLVNATDVTLKDTIIGGNLYLAEGIGEGSIFLDNVTVKSKVIVNGGGANSINIRNSELNSMFADKKQGLVNIVFSNTKAETVKTVNQVRLQLSQGSYINKLELNDNANLVLEKSSSIERLIITGGNVVIDSQGTIKYIKSASQFKINGTTAKAGIEYKAIDGKFEELNKAPISNPVYVEPENPGNQGVDKTGLATAIAQAQAKNEAYYTEESWILFAEALASAIEVNNNSNATQTQVNEALTNLTAAMNGLVEKEDPVDPEIDKTELVELIAEAQTKNEEEYTEESWAPFARALELAIQARDNEEATQEQVDESLANLTAAMNGLVEKEDPVDPEVDKTQLVELISEAQTKNEEEYTEESWAPFAQALASAIEIIDNEEATQEQVDESLANLTAAMNGLVEKEDPVDPEVDKTQLVELIAEAQTKNEEDYTEESWASFVEALQAAEQVNVNEEATQEQVNEALTNLITAMDALEPVDPEITNIMPNEDITLIAGQKLIVSFNAPEAGTAYFELQLPRQLPERNTEGISLSNNNPNRKIMNEISPGYYSAEWTVREGVAGTFEIVVNYEKDNKKLTKISEGKLIIVQEPVVHPVDKTQLVELIAQAQTKNEEEYTEESWAPFAQALTSAIAVNNNEEATQEQVDEALENLTTAMNELVEKEDPVDPEVDKTQLVEAIAEAQTKNEEEYTEESWALFAQALQSAIEVRDNEEATQEEVDGALASLRSAMNALVEKEDPVDPEVDKTQLVEVIADALTKNEEEYTEESWAPFAQALQSAIEVRDNEEVTQEQVDEAIANLITTMNALVEEDRPIPEITAIFHRGFIANFGHISIQVQNIERAAKFDVVYHLSDNPDGSQNIQQTLIVDIGQRAGLIFYDPNQYNTITIRIYDQNEVLIYTFTGIVPAVQ